MVTACMGFCLSTEFIGRTSQTRPTVGGPRRRWSIATSFASAWVIDVPGSGFGPGFITALPAFRRREFVTRPISEMRPGGRQIHRVDPGRDCKERTEGSPLVRANLAPRPCIRLDPPGVRTMKQPCASEARLRGSGPILTTASSHAVTRVATTSDRHQRPTAQARPNAETVLVWAIFSAAITPHPGASARRPGPRRS